MDRQSEQIAQANKRLPMSQNDQEPTNTSYIKEQIELNNSFFKSRLENLLKHKQQQKEEEQGDQPMQEQTKPISSEVAQDRIAKEQRQNQVKPDQRNQESQKVESKKPEEEEEKREEMKQQIQVSISSEDLNVLMELEVQRITAEEKRVEEELRNYKFMATLNDIEVVQSIDRIDDIVPQESDDAQGRILKQKLELINKSIAIEQQGVLKTLQSLKACSSQYVELIMQATDLYQKVVLLQQAKRIFKANQVKERATLLLKQAEQERKEKENLLNMQSIQFQRLQLLQNQKAFTEETQKKLIECVQKKDQDMLIDDLF